MPTIVVMVKRPHPGTSFSSSLTKLQNTEDMINYMKKMGGGGGEVKSAFSTPFNHSYGIGVGIRE